MKSKVLVFGLLLFGAMTVTSCSGGSEEATTEQDVTEAAVSEEVAAELNDVQDINDEVNQLDQDVDAFLDSLNM